MVKLHKNQLNKSRQIYELKLDELFETTLRPLKSKNARTMFKIFIDHESLEHLTTLDIQTKLEELDIRLSKKEINGWLRSLQDAGLITKKESRGKPTTIVYDDKYTFDMWCLTSKGEETSDGINSLLRKKTSPSTPLSERSIDDIAQGYREDVQQFQNSIDEKYIKLTVLRNLSMNVEAQSMAELMQSLTPSESSLEKIVYSCIDQGLLKRVEKHKTSGLLKLFLRLFGVNVKAPAYQLTEEGRSLARKLTSQH